MAPIPNSEFLLRVQNDAVKRANDAYVNQLKKEAVDNGKKFKDPRGKDYETNNKRGTDKLVAPIVPKSNGPKLIVHNKNKIREKNKHLDQWGPLGW